jgi:ribosomal protein S24E
VGIMIKKTELLFKKLNLALSRVEYSIKIEYDGVTPSVSEVRDSIVRTLGLSPNRLVIKKIDQVYGSYILRVLCNYYENEDVLKQLEPIFVLKRNNLIS